MKRRRILQALTTVPAAAVLRAQQPVVPPKPSPAAVEEIPVIEATIPDSAGVTVPSFFSQAQLEGLRRLSDFIFPATKDAPGALAAHAAEFLDFLISESGEERQALYRKGLDELNARAEQQFAQPFAKLNSTQGDVLLAPLRAAWTANPDRFTAFLRTVKSDILQATQNSERWVHVMSKRVRSAGGVGTYWFPID
jgi:Gluconate 2-dehydrogenase subunit 3